MAVLKTIVIATHNQDKRRELQNALSEIPSTILSLNDFPDIGKIEETGETLLENSILMDYPESLKNQVAETSKHLFNLINNPQPYF